MTLPLTELQRRDARIAELEAIPEPNRTRAEVSELSRLHALRNAFWQRFPLMYADVQRRVIELQEYARRHRLPLGEPA